MEMGNTKGSIAQDKKVEALHWEIQQWKSKFQFIDDETTFITRLLDSDVFEPNTPNLFERLEDYKNRLAKINSGSQKVRQLISQHESSLGGILEGTDFSNESAFYRKQDELQSQIEEYIIAFEELKFEIFNYAGSILKKRKPQL